MRAIRDAYRSTDKNILKNAMQLGPGGSTAVTAIVIDGRDLWVANIGDSRAILCERGSANQLIVDHEPLEERSHVPRVNGQLAVARAFGDQSLKAHLILNGLDNCPSQVMSNLEAIEMVKSIKDPLAAAKRLTSEALARKSKDDISCIVIRYLQILPIDLNNFMDFALSGGNPMDKKAKAKVDYWRMKEYKHIYVLELASSGKTHYIKADEEWRGRQELSTVNKLPDP
ncbi:probable protein phosphatase 2C 44 [Tanacetum coccineum]